MVVLSAVLVAGGASSEPNGPPVTRREFFGSLDYSRPELAAVQKAAASGDYDAAASELLTYMRSRRGVKHFINPGDRPTSPDPDYDTTRADGICRHVFCGGLADWYPPHQLGEKIDWEASPFNDREWYWGINRHEHWRILGEAYWATGDEKYAREFVSQLVDWITTRPVVTDGKHNSSPSWRTIEAGIRLSGAWPAAYAMFVNSPSFTAEANLLYLMSLVDHARHLEAHPTYVNWLTMEMNGLLHAGVLFPEHQDAARWRQFALDRLVDELKSQVYPDGMQIELTTTYHRVALGNLLAPLKLLELNGMTAPEGYSESLVRMHEAMMYLAKPCGFLPAFNDADARIETDPASGLWADARGDLRYGASRYRREDMLFVASGGAEGKAPASLSHAFPYAGYYVMRENWKPDSLYLAFDAGPFGAAHQHEDKLGFDAFAYGETLLYDPGRYSYADPVVGPHIRSSWAHNTCIVDGCGQARAHQPPESRKWVVTEPLENPWISQPAFDYAEGVYDDGYGPRRDTSVAHRRAVLFVKRGRCWLVIDRLMGTGEHSIETLFHFAPGELEVEPESLVCATHNARRPNIRIAPSTTEGVQVSVLEGSDSPCQGWISTEYNKRTAAPVANYAWKGELPVEFGYLLFPSRPSSDSEVALRRIDLTVDGKPSGDGASAYEISRRGNRRDVVLVAHGTQGVKEFASFTTDAEVAVISISAAGDIDGCAAAGARYVRRGRQNLPLEAQQ